MGQSVEEIVGGVIAGHLPGGTEENEEYQLG